MTDDTENRPGGVLVPVGPGRTRDAIEAAHGPVAYDWDRYPVDDPGLAEHVPRLSDVDEAAGNRAARQVTTCFALVPPLAIAFVVVYFAVPKSMVVDFGPVHTSALNMWLGLTLGLSILLIGVGAIQWARQVMTEHEMVEERHPARSSDEARTATMAEVNKGISESAITRRKMIGRSMLGAVGIVAVPALVMLADLGPWPTATERKKTIERTLWAREGADPPVRLVDDVTFTPIKASDLKIGTLVNGEPEKLKDLVGKPQFNVQKAKAAIVIVRMEPDSIKVPAARSGWNVGGILAYSKICTHVGCAISLWEQQTHHLLCPCHQSTFDLADAGKVVFGPAARSLPQLPIAVDNEGYLVATSDFPEPTGPSYFERDYYPQDRGE
ncbi:MAG: cytochrome bc1 complex Rieske iron-sulfur subunit [Propionibacteriaceae bacterium]